MTPLRPRIDCMNNSGHSGLRAGRGRDRDRVCPSVCTIREAIDPLREALQDDERFMLRFYCRLIFHHVDRERATLPVFVFPN
ncbi:hypothetical protein EVAR_68495_1 [Eumeta japonica]|uniref:Uncharacterized protein n=1 Tax=Eumeta variegata TaxID=151549 RepID=A0A4C1ZV34_EUMVA|nr:hypothetical protein EVAR_68495_1 [Eumeta japonica]